MISFSKYQQILRFVYESLQENVDGTIEGFLDILESKDPSIVEMVVTGDIAGVTAPLKLLKRRAPSDTVMTDSKEEWILSNKNQFKKQYGDDWEKILYATANKLFK